MTSDALLLEAYAECRDPQAFTELVHRYAGLVFGVCLRVSKNQQDAEDIAQECFMELAKRAGTIKTSLPAWLHSVARFKSINIARNEAIRRRHEEAQIKSGEAADGLAVQADTTWAELSPLVDEAIETLPEEDRVPLIMYYLQEVGQDEIAERLGVSQSTVWRHLEKGVEELRRKLTRRGVTMSAPAFGALLTANAGVKAPATLMAELGKMAITGVWLPGAAAATVSWTKTAAAIFLVAAAVGGGTYIVKNKSNAAGLVRSVAPVTRTLDYPSPEHPTGWRGDGTGRFPGANPPLEWGRVCVEMKGLRFQTGKPRGTGADKSISLEPPDYMITDWLVLEPVPIKSTDKFPATKEEEPDEKKRNEINKPIIQKALDEETIPNEADMQPDVGEKAAGAEWKPMNVFDMTYCKGPRGLPCTLSGETGISLKLPKGNVALAHAYIYSEKDCKFNGWIGGSAVKISVNGKTVVSYTEQPYGGKIFPLGLNKGWNSILVKTFGNNVIMFHLNNPITYESKNVRWMTKLPQRTDMAANASAPIVVGDKVYAIFEPGSLVCMNRADGKIRWIQPCNYYEAADKEDRQKAEEKAGSLAAKLKALDEKLIRALNDVPAKDYLVGLRNEPRKALDTLIAERRVCEEQINGAMKGVDKKYAEHHQTWGVCNGTPCSDGKRIYAWISDGVMTCFELDGKPVWKTFIANAHCGHHGSHCSPLLVNGKLVVGLRQGFGSTAGLACIDAATGRKDWEMSGKVVDDMGDARTPTAVKVGQEHVIVSYAAGGYALSDGRRVWDFIEKIPGVGCASPVIGGDGFFYFHNDRGVLRAELPKALSGQAKIAALTKPLKPWGGIPSPLYHDGLVYTLDSAGTFAVFDFEKDKEKPLYFDNMRDLRIRDGARVYVGSCISPTLAGKYIYLPDNSGVTLIIEPGRSFKKVARNVVMNKHMESGSSFDMWMTTASQTTGWTFDGPSIFIRDSEYLYCIEEMKQ